MRLISLWEPWATLMAIGAKRIETRSWQTSYRGWLAIHASKGGLSKRDMVAQIAAPGFALALSGETLQFGKIVAVVDLIDCAPMFECDECDGCGWYEGGSTIRTTCLKCGGPGFGPKGHRLTQQEQCFGNYGPGRYGWVTDRLFRLPEPIPFRAKQGLCSVDDATVNLIREQYRRNHTAVQPCR